MKKLNENGGITLVALVITIIILLILAGVTISMVLGNEGLIGKAKQGAQDYKAAAEQEQVMLNSVNDFLEGSIGNGGSGSTVPSTITAADIGFTPDDSSWHVSTVAEALDYLFGE